MKKKIDVRKGYKKLTEEPEEKKISTSAGQMMDLLRGAKDLAPLIKEYIPMIKDIVGGVMEKKQESKLKEDAAGTPFSVQCYSAGSGLSICITIPKTLVDAYQINSGDTLSLILKKIVRR